MENITPQEARALVSSLGWRKIQTGHVWPSSNGQWEVCQAGYLYRRRPIKNR